MPQVLRRLEHHLLQDGVGGERTIAGSKVNGVQKPFVNGTNRPVNGEDVEMKDGSGDESSVSDDDAPRAQQKSSGRLSMTVTISHLAISLDGQWLASSSHWTSSSNSFASSSTATLPHTSTRIYIYNLDSISHHTTLPSFPLPVQHITFIESPDSSSYSSTSNLLLTFPNNSVQVYDVEERQFPAWGKTISMVVDQRLRGMHDAALGAFVARGTGSDGVTQKKALIIWSATWICKIGLDKTFTQPLSALLSTSLQYLATPASSRKRRRGKETPSKLAGDEQRDEDGDPEGRTGDGDALSKFVDCKVITTYRPILCVDRVGGVEGGKDELVVVERPLVDVLATLPPAYFKHRYGRS